MRRGCGGRPTAQGRALVAAILAGAVAAALAACGPTQNIHLQLSPSKALYDAPFTATVTGLSPGEQATLQLSTVARDGTTWASSAVFQASSSGQVSTSQAPVSGSYTTADPMGLVEVLSPGQDGKSFTAATPWTMAMSVIVNGESRATATATRDLALSTGVRAVDQRPDTSGVYGTVYLPAKDPATPQPPWC